MEIVMNIADATYVQAKWKEYQFYGVGRMYVRWLYDNGFLHKYTGKMNVMEAANGIVPYGFCVHHIVPLYAGGDNRFSNLMLMEDDVHKFVHRYFLDISGWYQPINKKIKVDFPMNKKVVFAEDYADLILEAIAKRKIFLKQQRCLAPKYRRIKSFDKDYEEYLRWDCPLFTRLLKKKISQLPYFWDSNYYVLPPNKYEYWWYLFSGIDTLKTLAA